MNFAIRAALQAELPSFANGGIEYGAVLAHEIYGDLSRLSSSSSQNSFMLGNKFLTNKDRGKEKPHFFCDKN